MDYALPNKAAKSLQAPEAAPRSRRRAPQQRTVETRERILNAGLDEFAKRGFDGASLPSIAGRAGVPHGLITYHFASKDGLWREVLRRTMTRLRERIAVRIQELRGVDSATTLRIVLEDFIRMSAENPKLNAVVYHAFLCGDERLDWLADEFLKYNYKTLGDLIVQAQAEGRFVKGDPYMLQYLFIGAATRTFTTNEEVKTISGASPFSKTFIDELIRTCMSLFFREPGGDGTPLN